MMKRARVEGSCVVTRRDIRWDPQVTPTGKWSVAEVIQARMWSYGSSKRVVAVNRESNWMRGDVSRIWGRARSLYGDVSHVYGDMTDIVGDMSYRRGPQALLCDQKGSVI